MSDPILKCEQDGELAILQLNRPDKRNAMNDALLGQIDDFFKQPPDWAKAVVLTGNGGNFCSGLDLSEHVARDAESTLKHSRGWHDVMQRIRFGGLPVISALSGAVIGGGLELASVTHVRVADNSAFFQLPEGRRGIFVGGGASVSVGRLIGADRMTEMMLTGRRYVATDALSLGLVHYCVEEESLLSTAVSLARKVADNAPLSNYIMIQALSRIEDMSKSDGLFTESLCAAITQTSPDAVEGLAAFLEKRNPEFR